MLRLPTRDTGVGGFRLSASNPPTRQEPRVFMRRIIVLGLLAALTLPSACESHSDRRGASEDSLSTSTRLPPTVPVAEDSTAHVTYAARIIRDADSAAYLVLVAMAAFRMAAALDDRLRPVGYAAAANVLRDLEVPMERKIGDFDATSPPRRYAELHEQMLAGLRGLEAGSRVLAVLVGRMSCQEERDAGRECDEALRENQGRARVQAAIDSQTQALDGYTRGREGVERLLAEQGVKLRGMKEPAGP